MCTQCMHMYVYIYIIHWLEYMDCIMYGYVYIYIYTYVHMLIDLYWGLT